MDNPAALVRTGRAQCEYCVQDQVAHLKRGIDKVRKIRGEPQEKVKGVGSTKWKKLKRKKKDIT